MAVAGFLIANLPLGLRRLSAVDCGSPIAPVYMAEVGAKEPGEPMEAIIRLQKASFDEWISDWLEGKDLWGEFYASKGKRKSLDASR